LLSIKINNFHEVIQFLRIKLYFIFSFLLLPSFFLSFFDYKFIILVFLSFGFMAMIEFIMNIKSKELQVILSISILELLIISQI